MTRTRLALLGFVLLAACGRKTPVSAPAPVAQSASGAVIDSLWNLARRDYRLGRWAKAQLALERLNLEFPPGDSRLARSRFLLGECYFAQKEHFQATREFRKVSDEMPNDPLAPIALLRAADTYADLWRAPQLDPTYGQTALATYQELLNRYPQDPAAPRAQAGIARLNEKFAEKAYLAGLYYLGYKAYDSAILYLKDLGATYPRTTVAPLALLKLVDAYKALGYTEDVKETCGYLRQTYPGAVGLDRACPAETTPTASGK